MCRWIGQTKKQKHVMVCLSCPVGTQRTASTASDSITVTPLLQFTHCSSALFVNFCKQHQWSDSTNKLDQQVLPIKWRICCLSRPSESTHRSVFWSDATIGRKTALFVPSKTVTNHIWKINLFYDVRTGKGLVRLRHKNDLVKFREILWFESKFLSG